MTVTTSRAGRNLPVAVGVSILLLGLIAASLAFNRMWFAVLIGAATLVAMWEFVRTVPTSDRNLSFGVLGAGTIAIIASAWDEGLAGVAVAMALSVVAFALSRLAFGVENFVRDVSVAIFGLAYIPFLASFAVTLATPEDGWKRVVILVLCVAANDTGGYAAGALFGRHKMVPTISPKKSWEGLAGSIVLTLPILTFATHALLDVELWRGALIGALAVMMATLGDLVESAIKRDLKIKDMGTFLPGHGGVLDRIDAFLISSPVIYLALSVLAPY